MTDSGQDKLKNFKPKFEFFVGFDSDGCVFDTMEIKHKECFIPNIIKFWDLQAVSKYAFETAEFVNLYSKWREHNIDRYVEIIAEQELGSKKEHLQLVAGGKYKPDRMLMVGDAPGDFKAARENQALFFPINPGREEESWERFYQEAIGKFFSGAYAGKYEKKLIEEFGKLLPEVPPWKK